MTVTVAKIQEISIYDTIHDFDSLGNNKYYQNFVQTKLSQLGGLKRQNKSTVEKYVTQRYGITMKKTNFVNFEDEHALASKNHIQNKKFFTRVNDFDNEKFKTWMGTIILKTTGKIDFVTDTTLLSYNMGCSIKAASHNGRFITNSSTIYDRGKGVIPRKNCVIMELDDSVEITKTQGHLFALESISSSNNTVQYKIPGYNKVNIDLTDYIKRDDTSKYKLSLYNAIVEYLHNGNTSTLTELLNQLQTRYNMPSDFIHRVKHKDKTSRELLVGILFDLKRAGDHMQVKSCDGNGRVFISNDRMSVVLATYCGVPTIRTKKFTDNTKEVEFYNMQFHDETELVRDLNKNMKLTIDQHTLDLMQFEMTLNFLDKDKLFSCELWINKMVHIYRILVMSNVSYGDNHNEVYQYECYYIWVVLYYFFSYLKHILSLKRSNSIKNQLDAITELKIYTLDDSHRSTYQTLVSIVDNILDKVKFWTVMNLESLLNNIDELKNMEKNMHQGDDIQQLTVRNFDLFAKSNCRNLIVGMEVIQHMWQDMWQGSLLMKRRHLVEVDVIHPLGMQAKMKTHRICVNPNTVSYFIDVQNIFKRTIVTTIVDNQIPLQFQHELKVLDVNEVIVIADDEEHEVIVISDSEDDMPKRKKRTIGGGGVDQRTLTKNASATTSASIADMRMLPGTHTRSHFRSSVAPKPVSRQSVLVPKPSTRPTIPQLPVVRTTTFEQHDDDKALIQVIIMFFLKTTPWLREQIIMSKVGDN